MIERLFSEFEPISTSQWEAEIVKDLKGADYDKKLRWKTDENLIVNPYYRAENTEDLGYLTDNMPNEYPFVRGSQTLANDWKIVQTIREKDPKQANKIAVDSIAKGANILAFNASEVATAADMAALLVNIDLDNTGIRFSNAKSYVDLAKLLLDFVETTTFNKNNITGAFDFDPISYLLLHNKFGKSQQEDLAEMLKIQEIIGEKLPHFQYITVNGGLLHNCGATIGQELGYSLATANEYLAFATDNGMAIDQILSKINVEFAISSNYFMEIAKLRAARLLWATLANAYNPTEKDNTKVNIFSKSSLWNKTIYDPYVNMLRLTTEGMSAAIGGADSIDLEAFDIPYKDSDNFSRRIARNTQILLKEEAYFGKIIDPGAGSYYIENLTDLLAEQAWNLFKEVENQGGIINLALSGSVKEAIAETCKKRDMDIATRKRVILGTNQYPNTNETMLDKITHEQTRIYEGLQPYRGAMAFEQLRLDTEKRAKTQGFPKVFLLKIGNVAMRQARGGFITNFFGCAGYQIIDGQAYSSEKEGVDAAIVAQANIVAICSSDEEYATFVPVIAQKLKAHSKDIQCVVAGNPTEIIEILKSAGVDDFIHVRSNLLETLRRYNALLGINSSVSPTVN